LPAPAGGRILTSMSTAVAVDAETGPARLRAAGALNAIDRRSKVRVWTTRPAQAASLIRRPRLVQPLCDPAGPPLVLVVAPAGYGKTTLVREWTECDDRPFAWLTLEERHNDPGRLLRAVTRAVEAAVVPGDGRPFVLVLDDAHAIGRPAAVEALRAAADALPPCATLALVAREAPALPVARMRAEHLVAELGAAELAMTQGEAAALLKRAGHRLDGEAVETLLHRTEGWPVALSLAAVYLHEAGCPGALASFGGGDRLVAHYVRDEIFAALPGELVEFAKRTSLVDELTGPLCDALLERSGSGAALAALAHAGLLVPLDRMEERFRYRRPIAETLLKELRRSAPERQARLHRRASAWHRDAGDVDRAVHHALQAGDVEDAATLVREHAAASIGAGRSAAVERWLGRFDDRHVASHPTIALAAAACSLARGQGHLVEHWASAAAMGTAASTDARAVTAGISVLRAAVSDADPARMRADAARAFALQSDDGPWRALCFLVDGIACHLAGERDEAKMKLRYGARLAAVSAPQVHALCLAHLALLAVERDDWEDAAALVIRARAQVERHGLGGYAAMALVYAVSAVVRARRGRIEGAQGDLLQAERLQAALTDFPAWYEVAVHVLLARTALRLSDLTLARDHLGSAAALLDQARGAVAPHEWVADARARLQAFDVPGGGSPVAMTAAELRILRYLPTHMSFREIAERTHVSANTVKTQANAVYRKLDVSCRSDAVARAREYGLLDD
jgi:LuxR family transcriptional regulator, maltose regulon positive regulatory protein